MSINLSHVKGTSEKLRRILRSHNIRFALYTENYLRKLFCKLKDRVATEDKINITYEINSDDSETVYFGESKRSLKSRSDKCKRCGSNCNCEKNEIVKHSMKAYPTLARVSRKLLIGKTGSFLGRSKNIAFFAES